jgi:hypothetical protein
VPVDVRVNAHELPACPVPERSATDAAPFRLTLTALGPFEAGDLDVEREIPLHEAGHPLAFNPETLGVDAVATDDELTYIGHSERRSAGSIDVLLWPEARACALTAGGDSSYPGPNGGQALGFAERLGLLLVAGENVEDQRAGSALVLDTQTGQSSTVERAQGALSTSRAFATVTPFGDGLLVAGGTNPFSAATSSDDARTSEVYSPSQRGFVADSLDLVFPRAHHAAVELPATGETLLVGGVVPNPSGGPGQEILQLEAVSPTQGASITDLGRLGLGRVDPTALVLTNGRIFVGGGYLPDAEDGASTPVGQVEWFAPDAGPEAHVYTDLPARPHRTFAPLPGGGVLTVASCNEESSRRDCACVTDAGTACGVGESEGWLDAFWIPADLTPRSVGFARGNVAACPTPKQPLLVPGRDGSPWLVSSNGSGTACLWRFEAWPEEPDATSDEPTARPRFVPTTLALAPAPDPASPLLAFGPDAFVWTSTEGAGGLFGARLGQRGHLTRDSGSLLDFDAQRPFRPSHLAPDRDPSDVPAGSPLRLRYEHGAVTLEPSEPPLTLFVTDTLYDDVRVRLAVDSLDDGVPPARPLVVFASRIGETSTCSWAQSSLAPAPVELVAERLGRQVSLTVSGTGERVSCDAPAGPVAIGIRAGGAPTRVTSLRVERL